MAFNQSISRTGITPLITENYIREIVQGVATQSAVLSLGRRLPNMTTRQTRMSVLDSLPIAGFVDGDTGLKATTQMAWESKYINAEEIAVIVPVPEAVLADTSYDLWSEIRPRIVSAFGKVIDAAVLIGTNSPDSWPDDLKTQIVAASQTVDLSTQTAANEDLYDIIMDEDGLIAKVEEDGFMVTGHVANMSMRGRLRGLRDATGQPIFARSMQDKSRYELDGEPIFFLQNDAVPAADALMFSGDWNQLVYSIRQDMTFKIFDSGVINDASGAILLNLMQQDSLALRVVMRLGWQVPNPINDLNDDEATRFPFSLLVP